jgi:hypothetical protein
MTVAQLALEQIAFARGYTLRLLDGLDPAEWFRMPAEGITHIGWQVGHLAMAEYRLALERIRGPRPADEAFISAHFLAMFARQSQPDPDPTRNPKPVEIRTVLDRVHDQVLREVPNHSDEDLAAPPTKPHKVAATKRASLLWCAEHEMLHAGQIGLLRRLLGHPPLW